MSDFKSLYEKERKLSDERLTKIAQLEKDLVRYEKERKLSDERLTKIAQLEKDLEMLKKENKILTKMRKDILKGELVKGSLKTSGYWESYVDKTALYMNLPAPVREHAENLVAARNEPCHDVNVRTDAE